MAISPEIRDQAYQFFIAEAPELLHVIEAGLLTLRHDRTTAKVHDLMRAAHSIKGGAASVELEAIASLAHRLENIFKALYSEDLNIDIDLENQLLQAYDCLCQPLTEQIATGQFDTEAALAIASPIFDQIEERLGDALTEGESYIPSSAELGVNLMASIFEVDVAQGLERLAAVIANPDNYEVAGELRAQVEVFSGFAEFLNLPGFGAIAKTAQLALDAHPDCALEITKLALADFELSRQAVMAGDTTKGGSPSAALVAFADSTAIEIFPSVSEQELAFPDGEAIIPQLDRILGNPACNLAMPTAESQEAVPSLDDIFGSDVEEEEIVDGELVGETAHETEDNSQQLSVIPSPETLEVALQSIGQIFDNLPAIEEVSALTWPGNLLKAESLVPVQTQINRISEDSPGTGSVSASSRQSAASPTPNLSVRVNVDRLERMNNLVGEFAINRNSLSLQNQQLQESLRELLNRFGRFRTLANGLRDISDQMLVAPERYGMGTKQKDSRSVKPQNADPQRDNPVDLSSFTLHNSADFDSLEMDSYGAVHSRIQGILEEMVQLEEAVDDIVLFARKSDRTLEQQRQMLTYLRDELMWARMLPIGEVLNRFPRVLRELSTTYHKSVNLKLSGTGVLVDKAVLEKLYDPLLHLLRNAFDHGIESPDIRRQKGKPEQGQIEIRAYHKGSQTIIEIRDDGQGLNAERIGRRAVEMGLLSTEQVGKMSAARLWDYIFEPGLSTAPQVSQLSGRGVGLDVVRLQLRSIKGNISVTSSWGEGTTFTLSLPLTLTIAKLLVCFIGSTAMTLPSDSVEEIVIPKAGQLKQSGAQRFLHWRGQLVPTYRLVDLLKYNCPLPDASPSKALVAVASPEHWALPMLVLKREQEYFTLEIDRLVTEQELVIKPFSSAIAAPKYAYGCTILGDGSLIPVIDGTMLLEFNRTQSSAATPLSTRSKSEPNLAVGASAIRTAVGEALAGSTSMSAVRVKPTPTILIVDDAVAMRQTLTLTLERAGFRVLQARDGREAIERLQQGVAVQLVICDVEMPNMNGFEFLGSCRQDPELSQIPIAMLTSRSSNKHRWLAMQLGASAYFTKPYLEQEFLRAIKEIVRQKSAESLPVLS
ncbi:MAG TPA: hybrid sensor histidine kinase/response regulator [Cyanobacteria bacterium UBA8803]|nr:hybrid sensor histidine kinase/response regulator [Cyanobacteria bacterium UBA9273]HBL60332.1 hybrid sensor histidine kinase/response regulator [Cyanobacteria bacterium UBA8803]